MSRSHMGKEGGITVDEVLSHLMTRSVVPSPLGAMLARLKDGVSGGTSSPSAVTDRKVEHMLSQAAVFRCVDALMAEDVVSDSFKRDLRKAAAATKNPEGYVVIAVMRAYQERALFSIERGLAEVFCWMKRAAGSEGHDDTTADRLAELFRLGQAKNARSQAKALEADCRDALTSWVKGWNRR